MALLNGYGGRERRRKGWVNRLRRLAYGLGIALGCCAPAAQAQQQEAQREAPPKKTWLPAWMLRAQQALPSLADTAETMRLRITAESSGQFLRLDLGTAEDPGRALGFALDVPDTGYLYVNLYSAGVDRSNGEWKFGSEDPMLQAPPSPREEWMLARGAVDENPRVTISPQLVMHLDESAGAPKGMEARVQYAPWRSVMDREGGDRRMPQIVLHWPFN